MMVVGWVNQLEAPAHTELAADLAYLELDRVGRHAQPARDFLDALAVRDELEQIPFGGGERVRGLAGACGLRVGSARAQPDGSARGNGRCSGGTLLDVRMRLVCEVFGCHREDGARLLRCT